MDPLPMLPQVILPSPNAEGIVVLDKANVADLGLLLGKLRGYVVAQLEKCHK